jgi:G:T-mismatch repair DNA endonuclease (very short patch repair protein)
MREAQKNAKGKKCEPGCTCNKHKAYYRGGSKKGRTLSERARENIAEGARNRAYTDEERERRSIQAKAQHQDPEWEARRIAALIEAIVPCPEGCACERHSEEARQRTSQMRAGMPLTEEWKANIGAGSKEHWAKFTPEERSEIAWQRIKKYGVAKVSKMEYTLAPYLAKLGYRHNDDRALVIGRKFPDFFDEQNRRVFEFFGNYWHPDPEEEQKVIKFYVSQGWECTVLWEANFYEWMREHAHLCSEEPAP